MFRLDIFLRSGCHQRPARHTSRLRCLLPPRALSFSSLSLSFSEQGNHRSSGFLTHFKCSNATEALVSQKRVAQNLQGLGTLHTPFPSSIYVTPAAACLYLQTKMYTHVYLFLPRVTRDDLCDLFWHIKIMFIDKDNRCKETR